MGKLYSFTTKKQIQNPNELILNEEIADWSAKLLTKLDEIDTECGLEAAAQFYATVCGHSLEESESHVDIILELMYAD